MAQWARELSKATSELKVTNFCPPPGARPGDDEYDAHLEDIASHDVVLCTYEDLTPAQKKQKKGMQSGRQAKQTSRPKSHPGACLSRIAWKRVVLDECQEVRSVCSKSYGLADACKDLVSDHRWMVSGTPLHTSLDDLNGELHFLGVWPFALQESEDGFWSHKIGQPWKDEAEEALPLLHSLLRGIMIRHSKSQTTIEGRPLLSLPPVTRRLVPVNITCPSHRYMYMYLESMAAAAMRMGSGDVILRLLRQTALSPSLLVLKDLDEAIRNARGISTALVDLAAADRDALVLATGVVATMPAQDALEMLMRPQAALGTAHDQAAGLVRQDNTGMRAYNTGRTYASETVSEKLEKANEKLVRLRQQVRNLAMARWRYAVQHITATGIRAPVGFRYWKVAGPKSRKVGTNPMACPFHPTHTPPNTLRPGLLYPRRRQCLCAVRASEV
mmetsp:Transcript_50196/g.160864  ORF Transcript_50196/g.160864 Transcript_50196/m.160864 type:complete len:444 (+) Transcript_50196:74-1405(+)